MLVCSFFDVKVNPVEQYRKVTWVVVLSTDCAFNFLDSGTLCLLQSPLLAIGQTGNCWPKNSKTEHLLFVAVLTSLKNL